ncbi:MAG: AAA family ATPase [bacterium]|jgi:hypothetical protein
MTKRILVCGDPTVDWLLARSSEPAAGGSYFWQTERAADVTLSSQPGGAALLGELLAAMLPADSVARPVLPEQILREPGAGTIPATWTVWAKYREEGRPPAYRIAEWWRSEPGKDVRTGPPAADSDLLVIDDSGLGFRDATDAWPEVLRCGGAGERPAQVLLKLSRLSGQSDNPLLSRFSAAGLADRTTIVTSVADLRTCAVRVSGSLSWEKLFEDIVVAVHSPACPFADRAGGRLAFARVAVTVGASGAVLVDREGNSLIFDRSGQEGDFARRFRGGMMGYNTCVTAALAAAWTGAAGQPDWAEALRRGLGLARSLHAFGYAGGWEGRSGLGFPCERIARTPAVPAAEDPDGIWNLGLFRDKIGAAADPERHGHWSILVTATGEAGNGTAAAGVNASVTGLARRIAVEGPAAALGQAPVETVGRWRSADRQEIEGVRSVNNAMREYLRQKRPVTPLSVAVFGPPGAGKSFAIKEIAKDLGIGKEAILTFNLSQFETPAELTAAFHQIRDLHLKGKMPLVFWDEFDTPCAGRRLGWLRYFLAPMQDGEFMEAGRVHPLGGGIFVFAGATRHSFRAFAAGDGPEELAAKKPDFVSRLRAYIDVRGPNANPNTVEDKYYLIRRAFLLNSFLAVYAPETKENGRFAIEPGVLDAFLRAGKYRHGARSLETIVRMSSLAGKRKYELSSLPPDHIIDMHTDRDRFVALTRLGHREGLRVGITGHIGLDPARRLELTAGIAAAAAFIENAYPERNLTVFSPLAVGADRIVARHLLEREGASLTAILPLPAEDYVNDFGPADDHRTDYAGAELRREFRHWLADRAEEIIEMPPAATRDAAYEQTGLYVARHCDVLLAVWDGAPPQGQGGTGAVVAEALARQKPVCHIWAGNYKTDPAQRTDVRERYGTIRHINFPGFAAGVWRRQEQG